MQTFKLTLCLEKVRIDSRKIEKVNSITLIQLNAALSKAGHYHIEMCELHNSLNKLCNI